MTDIAVRNDSQLELIQSLVSPKFAKAIANLPEEFKGLSEEDLIEKAFGSIEKVLPLDIDLRRNFWNSYSIAVASEGTITNESVYDGVCAERTFFKVMEDPSRVAFIITESSTDKQYADHLLYISWHRMKHILAQTPEKNTRNGMLDTKLMDLQIKLFQYLDERQNGKQSQTHIHEVNQKTVQINMTADEALKQKHPTHLTHQEVDKRLADLEEIAALPPPQQTPEIIDSISHVEKLLSTNNRTVTEAKKKDE